MSKVWLITGAGSGIGAGIAKAALRAADRVVARLKQELLPFPSYTKRLMSEVESLHNFIDRFPIPPHVVPGLERFALHPQLLQDLLRLDMPDVCGRPDPCEAECFDAPSHRRPHRFGCNPLAPPRSSDRIT